MSQTVSDKKVKTTSLVCDTNMLIKMVTNNSYRQLLFALLYLHYSIGVYETQAVHIPRTHERLRLDHESCACIKNTKEKG